MHRTTSASAAEPAVGYPLLGGRVSRAQRTSVLAGLAIGAGLAALYAHYLRGDDVSPDSVYGLAFATVGTALLLLVGLGYVLRKRLRRHWAGRLHTALAWHMVGGLLGLVLIFMHAAGNFNSRSGTYALYGLIAVVVSGIVGRALDRICPRLAAVAALATLDADGEERLEALEERLGSASSKVPVVPPVASGSAASRGIGAQARPWDLAYHELDPATQAVPVLLGQQAGAATDGRHGVERGASLRTVRHHVRREATALQRALGSEQFLLQLVRIWRRLHAILCLVAFGLLAWHIEYAVTLVLNTR